MAGVTGENITIIFMKSFNPYYLLYLIPFSMVGFVIYFIALVWTALSWYIAIIMVSLVTLTTFVLIRNILKSYHPKFGIVDERVDTLDLILNTIEDRHGNIEEEEMKDIIDKANKISNNPAIRPAERRMRMNAMLKRHMKYKNGEEE
jgi:hypothetical protein